MPRTYTKKGGHGGARRGAGRKRADNSIAQYYADCHRVLPLDYCIAVASGIDPLTGKPLTGKNRPERMDRAAIAALPYTHRRLAPISVQDSRPEPEKYYDYRQLTDEELAQLERLASKIRVSDRPIADERKHLEAEPE